MEKLRRTQLHFHAEFRDSHYFQKETERKAAGDNQSLMAVDFPLPFPLLFLHLQ